MDWLEVLGWKKEDLEDFRFVAYSYIKQGHYDTALTFFKALLILGNDETYDLQTIGALYLQIGDNKEALNHLDRALRKDDKHLPTKLNKAKALFALEYKEQAHTLTQELARSSDASIASQADALLLAYEQT